MESQHVKSINIDKRSNKRIKFASAKARSKRASADVYRSHKRKIGSTSARTREEAVHNPGRNHASRKRYRSHHLAVEDQNKAAVLRVSSDDAVEDQDDMEIDSSTTFADELDETLDRNASEIFAKFHRKVWPLVRSLPEILHHSKKILDLMLSYVLSPASLPERPSDFDLTKSKSQGGYIINHATTDVLHLLSVLARDLRHEIHPFVHTKILPRIIEDLLSPPPPASGKQPIPLDVSVVEAAFRCISYVLRYDADLVLQDMEIMRKYYGRTLAARRELTRRLAAETFAPIIRKMKVESDRYRHLKRVLKALVASDVSEMTPVLKRTQDDAIDGISQLVFELVRGIPGSTNSQGKSTITFIVTYCTAAFSKQDGKKSPRLLQSVAAAFLEKLCRYLNNEGICSLVDIMLDILQKSLSDLKRGKTDFKQVYQILFLLKDVVSFRSSSPLAAQSDEQNKKVTETFGFLFDISVFEKIPVSERAALLEQVCPVWTAKQNNTEFAKTLRKSLECAFQRTDTIQEKDIASFQSMSTVLAESLIPNPEDRAALDAVGSVTLAAAATYADVDHEAAILTVFALAQKHSSSSHTDNASAPQQDLNLFPRRGSVGYHISGPTKQLLIETCMTQVDPKVLKPESVGLLSVVLRCLPFVTMLAFEEESEQSKKATLKSVAAWIVSVFKTLGRLSADSIQPADINILQGLALEALSLIISDLHFLQHNKTQSRKLIQPIIGLVNDTLFATPKSLWVVRGVAALAQSLNQMGLALNDQLDDTFDALVPNLSSKSHELRLRSLQILCTFPKKNFVTDHADLDLEGDLDEDPSFRPSGDKRLGPDGQCNLMDTLLEAEGMRVRLTEERPLFSLVSNVEVLARSGKLPVAYAEAAAQHLLGMLYIRFAPLWPVVTRALVALATAQGDTVWPAIEKKLVQMIEPAEDLEIDEEDTPLDMGLLMGCSDHLRACREWERSLGRNIALFVDGVVAQDGEVLRHLTTDTLTAMESFWGIAEKLQQLVAKNSRVIVPTFLAFLSSQYFKYHDDDPISREIQFPASLEEQSLDRSSLSNTMLQRKLVCFLKVFASIDGPQQLVHHKVLEQIFRSLLSHQDTAIVKLSLSCLLKYKPKHMSPYKDMLRGILEKGRLRNALLDIQEAIKAGTIAEEHRVLLVPILSRILFGRLSVRESRSSKDSPAARRAAILSFIATLCTDNQDFFPFIYLMTRSFIPRSNSLKEIEEYTQKERVEILANLSRACSSDLDFIAGSVMEGFLHLLHSVVAQLGHRIEDYIPHLTSIVLELCKIVSVEHPGKSKDEGVESKVEDDESRVLKIRGGSVRTLCFLRLSEIFSQFGRSLDFSNLAPSLWRAVGGSIQILPEMVVNTERTPALLTLLETLSTEPSLVELLSEHAVAVSAVIKCIATRSHPPVMNSALTFVENLLDSTNESHNKSGRELIKDNIPLLLNQFSARLGNKDAERVDPGKENSSVAKQRIRSGTWRKELNILCRVSELISDEHQSFLRDMKPVLLDLCELLLPFLQPGQGSSDDDKLNVIEILKRTIPSVEGAALLPIFESLSSILAPIKARASIQSIAVRSEIAQLIVVIGEVRPELRLVASSVERLSAVSTKRVDEINFEVVIPELNSLGKDTNSPWKALGDSNPFVLAPLVSMCLFYLHDEDGVMVRASFNALKTLARVASESIAVNQEWAKMFESLIMPSIRSGLQSRSAPTRRFYVLIVREIAMSFRQYNSQNIPGDLHVLIDEDNPDLDFFMGVTHVQIHRRARAFQRLRKTLNESSETDAKISSLSLSSILLPLGLHPVYESKTKVEESIALEGIATVGAISRLLPWNKYHTTIWSILTSFDRNPEQERYLVGVMCAMLDVFSYDVVESKDESKDEDSYNSQSKSAVWRALERRIIPKVETLLIKEKKDRSGNRVKMIRPSLVLALLKLFQKFPTDFFESKLPHVLAVMCDALKSRESDARDVARNTMAKIATSLDVKYLADIVREITITLNDGYKLHVRAAVVHTILNEFLKDPKSLKGKEESSFDASVAALMDVLQEDLFGEASERRESQETNVRYVKEAGGSKSIHSVEMICRLLVFKPSAAKTGTISKSSIHCVVSPLLERLRQPDINASTIRKIKEILLRVVVGLSHNASVKPDELFPFVFATIDPFIGSQLAATSFDVDHDDEDEAIVVSGSRTGQKQAKIKKKKVGKVVEWRPSAHHHAQSTKAALGRQKQEQEGLRRVIDGASAPKLTGTGRHKTLHVSSMPGLNDPATTSAVVFGLNLMYSCLKKMSSTADEKTVSMMDPFVPILTACICNCKDNDVSLVAMKCIMSFLRFRLPSLSKCSKSLGTQTLTFLSSSGSSLNQNHDMTQACFKTLTYLINRDQLEDSDASQQPLTKSGAEGEQALATGVTLPLNSEQMKVLLSLITISISESDQHNPALGLIKAILSRRFQSPEFYDLMETLLKLNVRSQKASLRHQSAGIFIRYLIDYPMGEERFQKHLKQVVANINYEYQEGRQSAIEMLSTIIGKLAEELLGRHSQMIFLPLVLQLVNDDAKECREAVSKTLVGLLSRSSTEVLYSFHEYTWRWSQSAGPLQVASLQVFGLFIESSSDFIRSKELDSKWLQHITKLLETAGSPSEWEVPYFSLICVEKMFGDFASQLKSQMTLWTLIVERLIDSHPWIKLASARIVNQLCASPKTDVLPLLEGKPGLLFEITRNLCFQMNLEEEEQSETLTGLAVKTLTITLPLMKERSDLCFAKDSPHAGLRDPINWVLRRLSQIAKPKGRQRRMAVYQCFAAFATKHPSIVEPHLELLLEPLHRSDIEASNELENPNALHKANRNETSTDPVWNEATLARDVLQLIEESCSATADGEDAQASERFLEAYAAVKRRARDKKDDRKVQAKALAVQDPAGEAKRRQRKHERDQQRKKRRVEERRRDRGATAKRSRSRTD